MMVFAVIVAVCVVLCLVFVSPPLDGFLGLIGLSTVSSFGGGEAYVGVADGFLVAAGIVDPAAFYGQIVPVANALPGPILVKIAAGIGYVAGFELAGPVLGLVLAAGAFLVSIGSCCALALGVLAGYDRARHSLLVRNIASYILPVICGLLASTAVSMLHASARIGDAAGMPGWLVVLATLAVCAVIAVLHRWTHGKDLVVIVACSVLGLAIALVLAL